MVYHNLQSCCYEHGDEVDQTSWSTSGNQTRQWRIHSGFSQLVPPFRLASFWPCLISEGQPRLRGAKACSLDWSQVSGCLDRTWTVGKGLPETYHDWGWNRSHQNGWWLGDGIMCVYIYIILYIYYTICIYIYTHLIFYCPYLSLVTIAVVMSMIDFHGHRTKPWHSQVAARLGTKASTFSALELWDAALVQLRWKTWIPYK